MPKLSINNGVLLALLGGVLLGIGFVIPSLWPCALIGIAPLMVCVADRKRSIWHIALLGWLAGFAFYGLAVYGVYWDALPIAWLAPNEYVYQVALVAIGWTLTSAGLGLATAAWAALVRLLATDTWLDVITVSAAWVLSEASAALIASIQNYGPGSIMGLHFTLGSVGYQLASDTVLLQAAFFGGVYALSLIAAGIGALLYRAYTTKSERERTTLGILLICCALIWSGGQFYFAVHSVTAHSETEAQTLPTADIAALATDLGGPYNPTRNLTEQETLLKTARGADIAVLPEGSELLLKLRAFDLPMPDQAHFYIDSEDVRRADGNLQTQFEYYDARLATTTAYTEKRFLLPFGEYIPALYLHLGQLLGFGNTDAFKEIISQGQHVPGGVQGVVAAPGGVRIGALFCDEALSPTMYQKLAAAGANVLVNVSSQLWFNHSYRVFMQMQHAGAVRAVESRRWYVDASNATPAFVLDEYGRVVAETPWYATGVIRLPVPLISTQTPYDRFGVLVLLLPIAALILVAFFRLRDRLKL